MVEISCPHCGENLELEDGEYGTFSCPHCEGEFDYKEDGVYVKVNQNSKLDQTKTLEEKNQQDKLSSLVIIDGYMEEIAAIQMKQNIVNACFALFLIIALLPLILAFQLENDFERFHETEGFESLIQVSLIGWGLAFVTFLFPYNERIKKLNRKIKSERK
jgi:uncharacterized Zn finger protein (UPF0148 family)